MFCLLVVLVKLSLLAKWLARKTPLRKPNRGKGIVSRKPRPNSVCDSLCLLYCFIMYLCCFLPLRDIIIFILLWRDIAYLCWKCHNFKQTNKPTTKVQQSPLIQWNQTHSHESIIPPHCYYYYYLHSYKKYKHWKTINTTIQNDTPQALSPCNTKPRNSTTVIMGPEFAPKQTTTVILMKF